MRRGKKIVLLLSTVALVTMASPSGADDVTGQGHPADAFAGPCFNYFPSTIEINKGSTFKFGNYDPCPGGAGIAGHSLDEVVEGCTAPPYTKNNPGNGGTCTYPRFTSGLVDHGHVHPVAGVETLEEGSYRFTCQVHNFMKGTLVVK